jgi:hypothetical protein
MAKSPSDKAANRDPISKKPGAHPVGTGVGAAAGGVAGVAGAAAAGAAAGSAAGPVGTAAGLAVGAVVGGLAGKGVAEKINPTRELEYWRGAYQTQPYYNAEYSFEEDYAPAYRLGYESYPMHQGRSFSEAESDLQSGWEKTKGKSRLSWEHAKEATRAAYNRAHDAIEDAIPGDSDHDGH